MWYPTTYETTKLTLELRDVIEGGVDLWAFDYPSFYQGEEKKAFEQKVIDHYFFRQIGQETVGRFLHVFRAKIREIMPYYIQLYELEADFKNIEDPFESYNLTEEYKETRSDSGTASGSSTSSGEQSTNSSGKLTGNVDNERRFSNTPQGRLENLDNWLTEATVENNGSEETSTGSSTGTSSGTSSDEHTTSSEGEITHTLTRKGNIGVQPLGQEIVTLRNAFIDVDMKIIEELNCLFLGVY